MKTIATILLLFVMIPATFADMADELIITKSSDFKTVTAATATEVSLGMGGQTVVPMTIEIARFLSAMKEDSQTTCKVTAYRERSTNISSGSSIRYLIYAISDCK
jgi:hypothetical protein